MKQFKKVLIATKSTNAALPYIEEAVSFLRSKGIHLYCTSDKARFLADFDLETANEKSLKALDMALVFGGDGTILKTARLLLHSDIPLLGVNMGTVGYLADTEPKNLLIALEKLLAGEYKTEHRCTLRVTCNDKSYIGLNEAVVARGELSHILTLNVKIDGQDIETIRADGVIVSTPTGSTAYNLSAGGPIIAPLSRTFVLTPICAHSLTARPIVIGDNSVITLQVSDFRSKDARPSLDIDGKTVLALEENAKVDIALAKEKVTLIRTKPTSFYKALQLKLGAVTRGDL